MSDAIDCPACGAGTREWPGLGPAGPEFDPFRRIEAGGRLFGYRSCPACGLLFAAPTPTPEELERVYDRVYDFSWFQRRRPLKRWQARHRWHRLRRLGVAAPVGRRPRLLDVGAGQGDFVRVARAAGWDAVGLDPAAPEGASDDAVRRGGEGELSTLEGPFDLITFWHCLEHLRDPRAVLAAAGGLLAPEGRLVLAVPNRDARGLARAGRAWGWLQQPFVHLWHFTPRALAAFLPRGLELRRSETREAWDQQSWFAGRAYGMLVNRLPESSVRRREALHLLSFALAEATRPFRRPDTHPPGDRPELVVVVTREGM